MRSFCHVDLMDLPVDFHGHDEVGVRHGLERRVNQGLVEIDDETDSRPFSFVQCRQERFVVALEQNRNDQTSSMRANAVKLNFEGEFL